MFNTERQNILKLTECRHCWFPGRGEKCSEKFMTCDDKDIIWVLKESLRRERLKRMEQDWTKKSLFFLNGKKMTFCYERK